MATAGVAPVSQNPALLWRNRTFFAILIGHSISVLGDGFHTVALGLWVLQTTGSATAMATVMAVRVIVGILLGAPAGTVVDRVDRRRLMVAMDLTRVLLVGGIAWLVATPGAPLWAVLLLTALSAVCAQFFGPAFQASLIQIVGREALPKATGMLQVSQTLMQVVGPFVGGTVVALAGGPAALAGDALSFLVGGLLILAGGAFPSPRRTDGEQPSFWQDLREGVRFIGGQPLIRSIVTMAPVLNFFATATTVLLPVLAVRVWKADSVLFGALEASFPLGFAMGAAAVMLLAPRIRRRGLAMMAGAVLTGLMIMAASLAPTIQSALPVMVVAGAVNALTNVLLQIVLQGEVPAEVQGRVFGTLNSLVQVATPLAMMAAGFLGDHYNPVLIAAAGGLLTALTGAATLGVSPVLRSFR